MSYGKKMLALGMVTLLAACGGSSGTSSTTATAAGVTDNVDGINADLSNLDLTQKAASASISVAKGFGQEVGDDSPGGCQLNQMKKEAIRTTKEVSFIQCAMKKLQEKKSDLISDGSYSYYLMTFGGKSGGEGAAAADLSMLLRVGQNISQSDSLEIAIVEGGKQMEDILFTGNSNTATATIKHHFVFDPSVEGPNRQISAAESPDPSRPPAEHQGVERYDDGDGEFDHDEKYQARQQGIVDDWAELNISANLKSGASGTISIDEIASATVDMSMDSVFGKGSLQLIYDEDGAPDGSAYNQLVGIHEMSFGGAADSMTGAMGGQFDNAEGSVKFRATGTTPGMPGSQLSWINQINPGAVNISATYCMNGFECIPFEDQSCFGAPTPACVCQTLSNTSSCTFTHEGSEHFAVSLDSSSKPQYKIAATSIYATGVAAITLPTSVTGVTKSFTRAWDGSTPSGSTLQTLDVSGIDFSSCEALQQEGFDVDEDRNSCFEEQAGDLMEEGQRDREQGHR